MIDYGDFLNTPAAMLFFLQFHQMIILLDYLAKFSLITRNIKLIIIHIGHHNSCRGATYSYSNLLGIKKKGKLKCK